MGQAFGFKSFAGVGEESTYGLTVARSKFFEIFEDGIQAIRERSFSMGFRGRSKNLIIPGKSGAAGMLGTELHYEGMEVLLKHLFGAVATTDVDIPNSVKKHTFTLADEPLTGLSLEIERGSTSAFVYNGVKINSGTLIFEQDAAVKLTMDLIAKQEALVAASAPTFPTFNPIIWTQALVTWGGVSKETQRFELVINQNLDADRRKLGDREILEPTPADEREVTGQFDMFFETLAEYNDWVGETEKALVIEAIGAVITPSAKTYKITVTLPRVLLTGTTPVIDSPGGLSIPLPFEAFADELSSPTFEPVKIELINQTATV